MGFLNCEGQKSGKRRINLCGAGFPRTISPREHRAANPERSGYRRKETQHTRHGHTISKLQKPKDKQGKTPHPCRPRGSVRVGILSDPPQARSEESERLELLAEKP